MAPAWLAGLDPAGDGEWIDSEQRGLVLRVRRRRMIWFVRYLFEDSARRYRIGAATDIGLSAARKLVSFDVGVDLSQLAKGLDFDGRKRRCRRPCLRQRLAEETPSHERAGTEPHRQRGLHEARIGED